MIHAFNFSCHRDRYLSELMETTLYKYCKHEVRLKVINTDTDIAYVGYGNGSGWPQGMRKISYLHSIVDILKDDDWVLSVDSDVVFCNGDVFDQLDLDYGIIGILGQQPWDTVYGKKNWAHMSGCLIFLRGDVVKQICSWSDEAFERIRQEQFKSCGITENEDVMLSYFAMLCAAPQKDIGAFNGSNFEQDVQDHWDFLNEGTCRDPKYKSFYHLNYNPVTFMGIKLDGAKWEIPGVLKQKGIEL